MMSVQTHIGDPIRSLGGALRLACRVGQRKNDRPGVDLRHLPNHFLGERAGDR